MRTQIEFMRIEMFAEGCSTSINTRGNCEIKQTFLHRIFDRHVVDWWLRLVLTEYISGPRDSFPYYEGDCAEATHGMEQLGLLWLVHQ